MLENIINTYNSIEEFAELNKLKICKSEDYRYILNYDEVNLWTTKNEVSYKCRGSVYYWMPKQYKLVARTFSRFFNEWEKPEYLQDFIDYSKDFYTTKKEDWSLILLYYWNGSRVINTRWSFWNNIIHKLYSWTRTDLFWEAFNIQWFSVVGLDIWKTYIFELCSPFNQVVEYYPEPILYHITTFILDWKEEEPFMNPVKKYECKNIDEVNKLVKQMKSTEEWIVACQKQWDYIVRKKIKTETWVKLAHLWKWLSKDKLREVIIKKEKDEVTVIFPHLKQILEEMDKEYIEVSQEIKENYEKYKDIPDQKEFALSIKDYPYKWIYFQWRKTWVDYEWINIYFIKHPS